MDIRVTSTVFQVFASNLTGSLNFYRLLGLPVPDSDGPHVAVELPGGNTLSFDNEETIAAMHPGWAPPSSSDPRLTLAFGVEHRRRGRRTLRKGHRGRLFRLAAALRRAVGAALCDRCRPGRQLGGSVRAAVVLTKPSQRHAGERADLTVQMRLVRVARAGGDVGEGKPRIQAAAERAGNAGCAAESRHRSRRRRCTGAAGCAATNRGCVPGRRQSIRCRDCR